MPLPPYLALLRAGFCLPPALPPARCALTAPFHPYSPSRLRRSSGASPNLNPRSEPASPKRRRREGGRYVFCATVRQVALPGRYPAHCPSEFGLSSRLRPSGFGGAGSSLLYRNPGTRASGRLADCDGSILERPWALVLGPWSVRSPASVVLPCRFGSDGRTARSANR